MRLLFCVRANAGRSTGMDSAADYAVSSHFTVYPIRFAHHIPFIEGDAPVHRLILRRFLVTPPDTLPWCRLWRY